MINLINFIIEFLIKNSDLKIKSNFYKLKLEIENNMMRHQSTIDKLKTMTYDVVFIDFFSIKPSERISFQN